MPNEIIDGVVKDVESKKVNTVWASLLFLGNVLVEQIIRLLVMLFTNIIPSIVVYVGITLFAKSVGFTYPLSFLVTWFSICTVEIALKAVSSRN